MSLEKKLWKKVKACLPPKTHATRIENIAGTGVPDSHVCHDGRAVWFELKIAKANKVSIRPSQIAWNMAYSQAGGISFFLVSRPSKGDLFLFEGGQACDLHDSGIENVRPVWSGSDLSACVSCALGCATRAARAD